MPAAIRRLAEGLDRVGAGGAGQAAGGREQELGRVRRIEAERAQRAEHPVSQLVRGERPAGRPGTQPEQESRLEGLPDGVPVSRRELVDVDQHPAYAGGAQQLDRRVGGAAVHQDGHRVEQTDQLTQGLADLRRLHGTMPREAARGRHGAGQHARQQRLVELDEGFGPGQPSGHLGDRGLDALGQRLTKIATGAGVGEHPVPAWALHRRGQGPRPGHRVLDRPLVALRLLLELVKIGAERGDRQPVVPARAIGQSPPGRLQVDRQAGEERRRPADHPRVRAPGRQLGQVRQLRTLGERDLDRVGRVGARPGPDPGAPDRRAVGRHAAVAAIVALPTTRVPA